MAERERREVGELERQVVRGNLFAHTVLSAQAERANETAAVIDGLVDLLVRGGVVTQEDLLAAVDASRRERVKAGDVAGAGVALRVDGEPAPPAEVDCERRLPVCKAACCRLRFALSAEEVEAGIIRWDLGVPYYNRQGEDGYCHQLDRDALTCGAYEDRPPVCRSYNCADDPRIWTDFDAMELNHQWIEANLGADHPRLVEMLVDGRVDL